MRLYIIRHAEPDYPNNTITAQGHREAAALARRLATLGLGDVAHLSAAGLSPQPRGILANFD